VISARSRSPYSRGLPPASKLRPPRVCFNRTIDYFLAVTATTLLIIWATGVCFADQGAISRPALVKRVDAVERLSQANRCQEALESANDLSAADASRWSAEGALLARLLHVMGNCYLTLNMLRRAEATYRQALALRERLLSQADIELGRTVHNLAIAVDRQGRSGEAEVLYLRAINIWDAAAPM